MADYSISLASSVPCAERSGSGARGFMRVACNRWLDFSLPLACDFQLPFGLFFSQRFYAPIHREQNLELQDRIVLHFLINEAFLRGSQTKGLRQASRRSFAEVDLAPLKI